MTTTAGTRLIPITDDVGRVLVPGEEFEPLPGSIILTQGAWGTAHQKFFSDGLWYPASPRGGGGRTWESMLTERNLVLVYDAAERENQTPAIFQSNKMGSFIGSARGLERVEHAHLDTGECIKNRSGQRCES